MFSRRAWSWVLLPCMTSLVTMTAMAKLSQIPVRFGGGRRVADRVQSLDIIAFEESNWLRWDHGRPGLKISTTKGDGPNAEILTCYFPKGTDLSFIRSEDGSIEFEKGILYINLSDTLFIELHRDSDEQRGQEANKGVKADKKVAERPIEKRGD